MDQFTKANINLNAILRNLKDLCEMDKESYDLVKDKNLTIQFIVKGGIKGSLSFENGKVSYRSGTSSYTLHHLNILMGCLMVQRCRYH